MHPLGSLYPVTFSVTDADGALTNADTVTLTITLPDETTTSPAVTNPPDETGVYTYDYPTAQAGRHEWRATTTGPTAAYGPVTFNVDPATAGPIVGLIEVKKHLNMDLTRTADDAELLGFLGAATPIVEDVVGPVVVRSVTEVHDGGPVLVLDHPPVVEVTSLTAVLTGGTGYAVSDVDVDPVTGVVRLLTGARFAGPLRATYRAGRPVVPDNIIHGSKELIRHMWATQRGHSGARPGLGDEDMVVTGSGFAIPRRVLELLAPHKRAPMLA